jgi:glutaredoxin-like protein
MRVDPPPASVVEVYWRPGCGFCSTLLRGLRRSGLPLRAVDIWRDPKAAALVRSLADGNETVPTVVVGAHALVNPTVEEVLETVAAQAPHLLPTGLPCPPRARRWSGWWAPLSSVGLAALWAGLAIWHPTTTYHLGPLLAPPPGRGWSARGPASRWADRRRRSPPAAACWSRSRRSACWSRWAARAARPWSVMAARPPNRWCCSPSAAPTGCGRRAGRRPAGAGRRRPADAVEADRRRWVQSGLARPPS